MKRWQHVARILRVALLLVFVGVCAVGTTSPSWPLRLEHERRLRRQAQIKAAAVAEAAAVYQGYACARQLAEMTGSVALALHVPSRLVAAIVVVESSCRPRARSSAGAVGLMQVCPRIVQVPARMLFDPRVNLWSGTALIGVLIAQYGEVGALRRYFGITPGSRRSWLYARHVLREARR